MYLICHMTSQDHVTQEIDNLTDKSIYPATFGGRRHIGKCDIQVLVCHVISQDHETKRSCDFKETLKISQFSANSGGHRHCGSGDMVFFCF